MNNFKNIFTNKKYLFIGGVGLLLVIVVGFFISSSGNTFSSSVAYVDGATFKVERIKLNDNNYNDNQLTPHKIFQNYDNINKMIESNCNIDGKTVCHLYKVSLEPNKDFENVSFTLDNLTLKSDYSHSLWRYVLYTNDGTSYLPDKDTIFASSQFDIPDSDPMMIYTGELKNDNSIYLYLFIYFMDDPAIIRGTELVSGNYNGEFKLVTDNDSYVVGFNA